MKILGQLFVSFVNFQMKVARSMVRTYNNFHPFIKIALMVLVIKLLVRSYELNQELEER